VTCLIGYSQVTDDFTDGDFTSGPAWSGSSSFGVSDPFEIAEADNQLRSQDLNMGSGTRIMYLSSPDALDLSSSTAEWNFRMRLGFSQPGSSSTNGNNTARVYLMSDASDLSGSLNGYYVELRYPDSDVNEVRLFRQDGSSTTELNLSGVVQFLTSQAFVDVTVNRSEVGLWEVAVNSTSQGTVTDNTYNTSIHFGVQVRYTANSRDNGFYFDDFSSSVSVVTDTDPPSIQSITAISDTQVEVQFNEDVGQTTAETTGNYAFDNSVSVSAAIRDGSDLSLVTLTTSSLTNGTTYEVTINNVEDVSGNVIASDSQDNFQYLVFEEAVEFDVVINEFMPDPNPVVALPDAEFVELYNRSSKFFDLANWTLDGQTLPTFTFAPDSYVIIVEDDDAALFSAFSYVIPITTLSLNNSSSDNIELQDDNTDVIHSINFEGSTGGTSTELINPNGPDYSENNYGLSTDPDGGTPGEQNSIFDDTPDTTPPSLTSVVVISSTELDITFDEPVEQTSSEDDMNYSIDGGITVTAATRDGSDNSILHLVVSSLTSGIVQTLTVNGVEDLSGNAAVDETGDFEYIETEAAVANDVVINEFYAIPDEESGIPNAEFVELYNRSAKFIDLEKWILSDQSSSSSPLASSILRPDSYVILTESGNGALFESFGDVLEVSNYPALNNSGDEITIQDSLGLVVFSLSYSLAEPGFTTELINPEDPCLSIGSYAFSTSSLGGTPGTQNSVFNDSPDTIAPTITSFGLNNNLTINFSEVMEASGLMNGNYLIDNLTVNEIIVEGTFPRSVTISFVEELTTGLIYEMTISNLSDCSGNLIEETPIEFSSGRSPGFNEVIITEILYDADPSIGLPEREFIEIYNTTNDVISTENMQLTDATSTIDLPVFNLEPLTYYVLTTTSGAFEFSVNSIGVSGFPSLNNSGELLILSFNDDLIFSIDFDPGWQDEEKSDGGYSLEMIDVNNPCVEDNNWRSSVNPNGGTPGQANSITESIPDSFGPTIIQIRTISTDTIELIFDEKIDPSNLASVAIDLQPLLMIDRTFFDLRLPNSLFVILNQPLEESISYSITAGSVFDCNGNEAEDESFTFALPSTAEIGEIKLSEVLFNPRTNGVDFVEIFNDSERYLELQNWQLARITDEGISDAKVVANEQLVIEPNEYLVFTTDASILLNNYPNGISTQFVQVASLPTYANDTGNVVLINSMDEVQEQFFYSEDFHYNLLESVDGVSLERVSLSANTNDPNNWRSASSTEGFATPGYANSQTLQEVQSTGEVLVNPKVFIPGNTGTGRDFTTINYEFETSGQFANVNIYDQTGRLIRNLVQGELLSTSGFLRWDGVTNSGEMARLGYYVVVFEVFDSSGNSETLKETVVVGRDF
ncbi:MAG: lamin tail domain-containing protein, partial [Bacteroidota bacterium]